MSYQSEYSGAQVDEAVGKALNPDAAPTADSTNLVESGGVASAISAVQNTVSRRNLLDNWYFVGGGSQQGGGQFPINQRGNTSYSGAVYGIDRWKGANAYGNIAVQSDGLQINSIANAFFAIDQIIENGATNLNGKTVTLSVLLPSGDIVQGSATLNLTGTSQAFIQFNFSGGDGIAQVNASTSGVSVRLRVQNNKTVKVAAVKLELGSISTLANDAPPNYAEELAKCQRYYWDAGFDTTNFGLFSGVAGAAGDAFGFLVPTPVPMRVATPTVTAVAHWVRGEGNSIAGYAVTTTNVAIVNGFVYGIGITKTGGFSALKTYWAAISKLTISCDI